MTRVLITAFEPYDCWSSNSSWMTVIELTREMPAFPEITTRLYPVDFGQVRKKLEEDLTGDYDLALHLGQAPGATGVQLEMFGLNVGGELNQAAGQYSRLLQGGPDAYASNLPLADWAERIREAGIPATVSYHAGTYLCNATLYLSQHIIRTRGLKTQSAFIHLPLDVRQSLEQPGQFATLPMQLGAQALRTILDSL